MSLEQIITRAWYQDKPWVRCLSVLTPLYRLGLNRAKKRGIKQRIKLPVPVIVVGNITVGGTGKTPLIIFLAKALEKRGRRVGIVSRGYGGRASRYPYKVLSTDTVDRVGDEPLMLAQTLNVPVVIDPDRLAAIKHLLEINSEVDLILSDDGMQHYSMPRDMEILVVDGSRELGNEQLLPAGPLREPIDRLRTVDFCLVNGARQEPKSPALQYVDPGSFRLVPSQWRQVATGETRELGYLPEAARVLAIAGIGNPERFYDTLKALGIEFDHHSLNDHQLLEESELARLGATDPEIQILMTTKDEVKYRQMIRQNAWNNVWALEVAVEMEPALQGVILDAIEAKLGP
ncbi:MAG: tetraacyldisaccharide 4'-kinase [Porticoccaceae bacterium]